LKDCHEISTEQKGVRELVAKLHYVPNPMPAVFVKGKVKPLP
jgi:hypothetical protein